MHRSPTGHRGTSAFAPRRACPRGPQATVERRPGASVRAADLEEVDRGHVLGLVRIFGELGGDALVEELLHGRGHRYLQVRQLFAGAAVVSNLGLAGAAVPVTSGHLVGVAL